MKGILIPTALAVLLLGTLSLQTSYQDDVNIPPYAFEPDSLSAVFSDDGVVFDPDGCDSLSLFPTGLEFIELLDFSVSGPIYPPNPNPSVSLLGVDPNNNQIFEFFMPNIVDDFDTKLMRIQITYCAFVPSSPTISNVVAIDSDNPATSSFITQVVDTPFTPSASYFYEDWQIHPNPDHETITILVPEEVLLIQVVIDTKSFDERLVGGSIIPIDSTSLLIASIQSNAFSILGTLTLVSAGVFGVLYYFVKRRN